MILGSTIVSEARKLIGTPFHLDGRVPGVGVDCGGVVVLACAAAGLPFPDPITWGVERDLLKVFDVLVERGDFVPVARDWLPGDVLVIRSRLIPNHAALYSGEGTAIHAFSGSNVNRVVEMPLDPNWLKIVKAVYRRAGVSA